MRNIGERQSAALDLISARVATLQKSARVKAAFVHALSLLVLFLVLLTLYDLVIGVSPEVRIAPGNSLTDILALVMFAMSGWILLTTWRRDRQSASIEHDLLSLEIDELRGQLRDS